MYYITVYTCRKFSTVRMSFCTLGRFMPWFVLCIGLFCTFGRFDLGSFWVGSFHASVISWWVFLSLGRPVMGCFVHICILEMFLQSKPVWIIINFKNHCTQVQIFDFVSVVLGSLEFEKCGQEDRRTAGLAGLLGLPTDVLIRGKGPPAETERAEGNDKKKIENVI
jgi:hypothetical protein